MTRTIFSGKYAMMPWMGLAVSLFLIGCSAGSGTPGNANDNDNVNANSNSGGQQIPPEEVEEAIANAADFQEWTAAVSNRPEDYQPSETIYSSDLIEQAHQNAQISEEQYYLLRLTAALEHDQLESQYQGEPDANPDLTSLLREIRGKLESFTPSTQEQLSPYFLSCDDPDSYWHDPNQPTAAEVLAAGSTSSRVAAEMERPAVGGDYFIVTGPIGTDEQQDIVIEALQHAYQEFADLGFNEPTDWIRVSLQEGIDDRGYQSMAELLDHRRCHLEIKTGMDKEHLQGVTAHELFHCFQEYMDQEADEFNGPWVWESTAVWAEEFAFPDNNTEHDFEDEAFSTLIEYFFDTTNTREYASYLFWFYVHQRDGKTGQAVKVLQDNMYQMGHVDALMEWPEFYYEFKEYALWNLNTDPYRFYEDADNEPVLPPINGSVAFDQIPNEEVFNEGLDIPAGGIMYFVYSINIHVGKLVVDLRDIQKTADNQNGIQLVWENGTEVHYEDLSYRDEIVFCRNRESENVDLMTFIISNGQLASSSTDATLSGTLVLDTTGSCAPAWRGYVECSWQSQGEGEGDPDDIFQIGNYSIQGWSRVDSTLLQDETNDVFYSVEDTASETSRYVWYWPLDNWNDFVGGTLWEKKVSNYQGSRTYIWEPDPGCPTWDCDSLPLVISPTPGGEWTSFTLRDRSLHHVGTYKHTHYVYYMPGTLGQMQGHVPELGTSGWEGNFNVHCPPDPLELIMSDDGLRLSGSHEEEGMTVNALYTYE